MTDNPNLALVHESIRRHGGVTPSSEPAQDSVSQLLAVVSDPSKYKAKLTELAKASDDARHAVALADGARAELAKLHDQHDALRHEMDAEQERHEQRVAADLRALEIEKKAIRDLKDGASADRAEAKRLRTEAEKRWDAFRA